MKKKTTQKKCDQRENTLKRNRPRDGSDVGISRSKTLKHIKNLKQTRHNR